MTIVTDDYRPILYPADRQCDARASSASNMCLHDPSCPRGNGPAQSWRQIAIANGSQLEGGWGGALARVIVTGTVRKQFFIFEKVLSHPDTSDGFSV